MQQLKGIGGMQLLNDSYSNDLTSLKLALQHFNLNIQAKKRSVIISDILQSGMNDEIWTSRVVELMNEFHIDNIFAVGEIFLQHKNKLPERTVEILDKLIEKLQDEHTSMIDEENNKEFKNYRMFKINEVKLMIYNETGNNTEVIKLKYNNSIFNKPIKEIEI